MHWLEFKPPRKSALFILVAFTFVAFGACVKQSSRKSYNLKQPVTKTWQSTRHFKLELEDSAGLSGLSQLSSDQYVSVAERDNQALILTAPKDSSQPAIQALPITGITAGLDLEAVCAVNASRIWIGTESRAAQRQEDVLFLVELGAQKATVVEELKFPYAQFKKAPQDLNRSNRGIEGLCFTGTELFVATEAPLVLESGKRFAMLSRYNFVTKKWTPFYVALNSSKGKISALSCVPSSTTAPQSVFAIERHYGISRIINFTVPRNLRPEQFRNAEEIVDISVFFDDNPNLEGLVASSTQSFMLLSDNQSSTIQGPTVWFEVMRSVKLSQDSVRQ